MRLNIHKMFHQINYKKNLTVKLRATHEKMNIVMMRVIDLVMVMLMMIMMVDGCDDIDN